VRAPDAQKPGRNLEAPRTSTFTFFGGVKSFGWGRQLCEPGPPNLDKLNHGQPIGFPADRWKEQAGIHAAPSVQGSVLRVQRRRLSVRKRGRFGPRLSLLPTNGGICWSTCFSLCRREALGLVGLFCCDVFDSPIKPVRVGGHGSVAEVFVEFFGVFVDSVDDNESGCHCLSGRNDGAVCCC
jgi:hypothetical protein